MYPLSCNKVYRTRESLPSRVGASSVSYPGIANRIFVVRIGGSDEVVGLDVGFCSQLLFVC